MQYNNHGLLKDNASALMICQRLLDPALTIGLLLLLGKLQGISMREPYGVLAILSVLLMLPIFKAAGLYRFYRNTPRPKVGHRIFLAWGVVLIILLFLGYGTKTSAIFSRGLLLSWTVLVPLLLYIAHQIVWQGLRSQWAAGRNVRIAVIAGATGTGQHLAEQIRNFPYFGIRLLGYFDDQPIYSKEVLISPCLGTLQELPNYVRQHQIDVVYIALPNCEEQKLISLLQELQDTTACVYFVPNIFIFRLIGARVYELNDIPLIAIWEIPFSNWQYAIKRLIDIAIAVPILICLAPLMALVAIGVKLSSPGPVLFKQRRYGMNGKEIIIYKFRTMKVMEDGVVIIQARRHDIRVTKFGRLLRRTSLDELPQFINVLQGRMSIVGPRPHAVAHNEQYRKLISGYMLRHKVKPGITGWAQIHGLRGETDTLDKMKMRIDYDLHYLKNWSLGLDLRIIFKTAFVVFQSPQAY